MYLSCLFTKTYSFPLWKTLWISFNRETYISIKLQERAWKHSSFGQIRTKVFWRGGGTFRIYETEIRTLDSFWCFFYICIGGIEFSKCSSRSCHPRRQRGKKSIKIHLVGASVNERGPLATPFEINWHFQKTLHAPLHALFPGVPRFTRVYAHDAPLLPSPSTLLSSFSAAINGQKRLGAGILCFLSWKQLGQIFWLARIHRCYATIFVLSRSFYVENRALVIPLNLI